MSNSDRLKQYLESSISYFTGIFANHAVTLGGRDEGRWIVKRPRADGSWDRTYSFEVVCLINGGLYVGGDFEHMIFAYGPSEPAQRVHWIGQCKPHDLNGYLLEKASIGMRSLDDAILEWDAETSAGVLTDFVREHSEDVAIYDQETYDLALNANSYQECVDYLDLALEFNTEEVSAAFEEQFRPSSGLVPSTRLICAYVAAHKLSNLLLTAGI